MRSSHAGLTLQSQWEGKEFEWLYLIYAVNFVDWKSFDEEGIVVVDYGGDIGVQYNPVFIAEFALYNFDDFVLTGNTTYLERFLRHVNWLVTNQVVEDGLGVWVYDFDFPRYGCRAPWISGMAQGQAISALVRAYIVTHNDTYLSSARLALEAFRRGVEEGGVTLLDEQGRPFYLEYVCEKKPHVLNGFIFALIGIHDFYVVTKDPDAERLYAEGLDTVRAYLNLYDSGNWTYYSLLGKRSASRYHFLHVLLLLRLYQMTGDPYFLETYRRWESYIFYH